MGKAAQTRLDAAENDRQPGVRTLERGGIGDQGAVGTQAGAASRRIGVIAAQALAGGVVVDHRIHGPGGSRRKKLRAPHATQGLGLAPVGLSEDADPVALGFEQARQ